MTKTITAIVLALCIVGCETEWVQEVGNDSWCVDTSACKAEGLCTWQQIGNPSGCIAATDADCKQSSRCKFDPWECTAVHGRCKKTKPKGYDITYTPPHP